MTTNRLRQIADEIELLKREGNYSDFLACTPQERIEELRAERRSIMAKQDKGFDPEYQESARTF